MLRTIAGEFLLKQYITEYTRVTNKCQSQIDLIFSNMKYAAQSGIKKVSISDHYPIFIISKKKTLEN